MNSRKNLVAIVICLVLLTLASCGEAEKEKNSTIKEDTKAVKYEIKNINNHGFDVTDTEAVYSLAKDAVRNFYYSVYEDKPFQYDQYFVNQDISAHVKKRIEYIKSDSNDKISNIDFGIQTIRWDDKSKSVFLQLNTCYRMDYGAICRTVDLMIISEKNGQLHISDWYSSDAGDLDEVSRGKLLTDLNDPNKWEDAAWVKSISKKADKYLSQNREARGIR